MAFEVDYLFVVNGLLWWVLAGVLVVVRFSDRLNRVAALFLFTEGAVDVLRLLDGRTDALSSALGELARFMWAASTFVLVYFAAAYLDRSGRPGLRRPAFWVILTLGAAIMGFYLVAPTPPPWLVRVLVGLLLGGPVALAALLAHDGLKASNPNQRRGLLLTSLGFAFSRVPFALHVLIPDLMPFDGTYKIIAGCSVLPIVYVLFRLIPAIRSRESALRADARRYLSFMGLVLGSVGALQVAAWTLGDRALAIFMVSVMVAWSAGFALIFTYSLLRLQVFGAETRTKLTIRRGTIAAIFVATFVVVSQLVEAGAQQLFGGLGPSSWVFGGIAAGGLLFALSPLERLAARVATVAVPEVSGTKDYAAFRRMQLYEAALTSVLEDGRLHHADRNMLDRLRTKLGLAEADALAIERDARKLQTV